MVKVRIGRGEADPPSEPRGNLCETWLGEAVQEAPGWMDYTQQLSRRRCSPFHLDTDDTLLSKMQD